MFHNILSPPEKVSFTATTPVLGLITALLLHILEVSGSVLGPRIGNSDRFISS
jgi:hypothetical protein